MLDILPGRPQSSKQALCTITWDGLRIVVYISSRSILIFNGRRELLQTVVVDEADELKRLAAEEKSGYLAVCDKSTVYIYEPIGREYDDLRWTRKEILRDTNEGDIASLSWTTAAELLVAGQNLALYTLQHDGPCLRIWSVESASNIREASISPDGAFIASYAQEDHLIKIWRRLSYEQDSTRFDVSYLRHEATVIRLSWRSSWHTEQNLDNLLYTFFDDGMVTVWAHAEPHSYDVLHQIACVDTTASIQPRRMSVGSISQRRYAFVLESRDLAHAAERALQRAKQPADHALEHLVQIANRSPEICIVLDDLGHMSAWGFENAGYRNKRSIEKFNVALLDGIGINLHTSSVSESCQIHAFANNNASASLCVLVNNSLGHIDWYEGSFTDFFDTAKRSSRLKLQVSWSGHSHNVIGLSCSANGNTIISWTDNCDLIVWRRTTSSAFKQSILYNSKVEILDVSFLDDIQAVLLLFSKSFSLFRIGTRSLQNLVSHCAPTVRFSHFVSTKCHQHRVTLEILDDQDQVKSFQFALNQAKERDFAHEGVSRVSSNPMCDINPPFLEKATQLHRFGSILAIVGVDTRTLTVWNQEQQCVEAYLTFTDEIRGITMTHMSGQAASMAIKFDFRVEIIREEKYGTASEKAAWIHLAVMEIRNICISSLEAICWVGSHEIAIASGNQIKLLSIQHDFSSKITNHSTILEDSALPIFHPSIIKQLLQQGEHNLANTIVRRFYELGKFISREDHIPLDLGLSPSEMLESELTSRTSVREVANLSDVLTWLEESMQASSLFQLSTQDVKDLRSQVLGLQSIQENREAMDNKALTYIHAFELALCNASLSSDADGNVVVMLPALPWAVIVNASLSKSQEALLEHISRRCEQTMVKFIWQNVRALGLLLFISDPQVLLQYTESVARAEYNRPLLGDNDVRSPVDCSLYYLVLNKKAVLQSLWRRSIGVREKENTMKLLAHDFTEERWKATALKNAYALLSRRRFEYAAAFFLLGGDLEGAANVCASQLRDVQLAIVMCRIWGIAAGHGAKHRDESTNILRKLVTRDLLTAAVESSECRWMAIWAQVHEQDYISAMKYLCLPLQKAFIEQLAEWQETTEKSPYPFMLNYRSNDPSCMISMFVYLRNELISRKQWHDSTITPMQQNDFLMRCVGWYLRANQDWLALRLVASWTYVRYQRPILTDNGDYPAARTGTDSQASISVNKTSTSLNDKVELKGAPTQFVEPTADSLLDSFGF